MTEDELKSLVGVKNNRFIQRSNKMYKNIIEINVKDIVNTNLSDPTIYGFIDHDITGYIFELNDDYAILKCLDTDEILLSGSMESYNGLCTWGEFVDWAEEKGVDINY
jgi:hypothetical protein